MKNIELAQICFITPILAGLEEAGVNRRKLESQLGLDKFNLENPSNYIPVSSLYSFFDWLSRKEGIADPQINFAKHIQLTSLAELGEIVAYAPDLLSALNIAVNNQGVLLTNEVMSFHIEGPRAVFSQRFTDKDAKGKGQTDFVNLLYVLSALRLALGQHWDPLEIHIQSEQEPCLDGILQPGSSTKVRCGQKSTAVVFSTELLSASMLGGKGVEHAIVAPETFQSKTEAILDSMSQKPNLHTFSQLIEINTRTIQRQLNEEGSSFSSVLERWRFKKAISLLSDQKLLIKEISDQLHYTEVSNFERAFKRWTKTTPGKYREL